MKYRVKKMPCKLALGSLKTWAKKALAIYNYQWFELDTRGFYGLATSLHDGHSKREQASVAAFQRWAYRYK